ncbi:RING zinc finger protein, putative [Plasmodium vinckei brucechwatti]|uniref:RING zinc finger protein, putative n=1 Tax=Plasmodium vinckei brucechwatti TaxID=119398 RepID=A0A6V7S9D0_PLAVN|nr:RING zinc finger protein, putative [Plasmodium vinckei brucechwatti]
MYISHHEEGINLNIFDINDLKFKPNYEYIIPIFIIHKSISTIQFANKYFEVQEIFEIEKSNTPQPNSVNTFISEKMCNVPYRRTKYHYIAM